MHPVLVFGANGGIGEAVVKKLLSANLNVLAISFDEQKLASKYKNVANCSFIQCDCNDISNIGEFIKKIVLEHGALRGMVYCAGFDKLAPLYLSKPNDFEALLRIHSIAPALLCGQISKKNNFTQDCSIVLISSLAAHEGAIGHAMYAMAKGALEGFLPSAAAELSEKGIRINIVVPGVVKTQMSAGFIEKMSAEQKNALEKSYPLGLGEPEDVANAIAFLISDEAKWITGQCIVLDGGHLVRRI